MAGKVQRYKVQWISKGQYSGDGRIRTVVAQGYNSAKKAFAKEFRPSAGIWVSIWPQGEPDDKREMKITSADLRRRPK